MKTVKTIVLGVLLYLCALSCLNSKPGPYPSFYLPGECLASDELKMVMPSPSDTRIHFAVDIKNYESIYGIYLYEDGPYISKWPAGDAWQEITNKAIVEEHFEQLLYALLATKGPNSMFNSISVFHSGELSVVADKPLMGCAPGENLSNIMLSRGLNSKQSHGNLARVLDIGDIRGQDLYFISWGFACFELTLPQEAIDRMENNEIVHFDVNLPVKVVRLLNYLDRRVEDPDAEFIPEDRVLKGSFSYQKGSGFLF